MLKQFHGENERVQIKYTLENMIFRINIFRYKKRLSFCL